MRLSAVHSRVLFCVSLRFSLSVSEIEKEISQLKTKETVTFLQTFIYFPLFVHMVLQKKKKLLAPGEDVIFLNLNYYMTAKTEKRCQRVKRKNNYKNRGAWMQLLAATW